MKRFQNLHWICDCSGMQYVLVVNTNRMNHISKFVASNRNIFRGVWAVAAIYQALELMEEDSSVQFGNTYINIIIRLRHNSCFTACTEGRNQTSHAG